MKFIKKSKSLLVGTGILLSVPLLLLSSACSYCHAQEKTYLITETQLNQLEQNLTTLKTQNQKLQTQLQISQTQVQILQKQSETLQAQSTQLQEQVQDLTQSLTNAQTLLTQYETSHQTSNNEKNYAVGLGIGNNGLAITTDIKNIWLVLDENGGIIGYKVRF